VNYLFNFYTPRTSLFIPVCIECNCLATDLGLACNRPRQWLLTACTMEHEIMQSCLCVNGVMSITCLNPQ